MKMDYFNGLLHTSLKAIIDTGAAQTLISADAVFDLGIFVTPDDELKKMSGIGGDDFAFRKKIDVVSFGSLHLK